MDSGSLGGGGGGSGGVPYHFTSDEMGNSHLQFEACRILIGLLIDHLSNLMRLYRVGAELAFYLDPADQSKKVVPDLYILEDEPQAGPKVPSWKHWEHEGKVPTLVVEVVSDSYRKDYDPAEIQPRYQTLGVKEVVRYDPDHATHGRAKFPRRLFGHFVRNAQGQLVEVPVESEVLRLHSYPLWLVHQDPYYLRIANGTSAEHLTLWPTAEEQARAAKELAHRALEQARTEAERADAQAERADAQAERADAQAERASAEAQRADTESQRADTESQRAAAAESEVARLRAELQRLRGGM